MTPPSGDLSLPQKNFSYLDIARGALYLLNRHKIKAIFWTLTMFLIRFYQLIPPIIISKIIDFFTTYKPGTSLSPFYTYAAVLGISHITAAWIRLTAKNHVSNSYIELAYFAKVRGFERLLDFSLLWHDKENTGNKVQRIQKGRLGFDELRRMINNDGLDAPASFIGIIFVFLFLQPIFVVFMFVYMILFLSIHFFFYKRIKAMTDKYNSSLEKANGVYYEGLNNVVTLKTLGAKDSFKANIYSNEELSKDFNYKKYAASYRRTKTLQLLNAVTIITYLLLVGNGVVTKAISVGAIFIFYSYLERLFDAAWQSIDLFDGMVEIRSAVARMMPIYWEETNVRTGNKVFPHPWNTISITNGFFNYKKPQADDETLFAIKDLNFHIDKGEKVGIVGHSGSGKSTLAKLLLGMYDLEKGSFLIEKSNYYDVKHSEVTDHIAIVLQESEMFNLSMQDNITLMKEFKPELFEKAISIAQLGELIGRLPHGINTLIGEKGYRLSGGERQRIGIARAIYKNPEIFVFDEATSALDSNTERLIQEALEDNLKDKTMVLIAHRISTLKNVHRIYVFDHGNVVEEGRYSDLIKDSSSKFYEVYSHQNKP
jgi:ABC-type multidrug transport system fused ATPase/permease subunit